MSQQKEFTLAEIVDLVLHQSDRYMAAFRALDPSLKLNAILWNRELKRINGEMGDSPLDTLPGQILKWPFLVETISETIVQLQEWGVSVNSHSAGICLENINGKDIHLYWRVGRDLTLAEAEKLRNGDIFLVRIRMASNWLYDDGEDSWSWEFVDYPNRKIAEGGIKGVRERSKEVNTVGDSAEAKP